MAIKVLMPALSPTMKEGHLVKWHKAEGDEVLAGDLLVEIETDKAIMEVEAVDEGKLGKIVVKEGSKAVKVNDVIALLLSDGEDESALQIGESGAGGSDAVDGEGQKKNDGRVGGAVADNEKSMSSGSDIVFNSLVHKEKRILITPLAKKISKDNNIDYSKINGSGPMGRIQKDDVLKAMNQDSGGGVAAVRDVGNDAQPLSDVGGRADDVTIPLSGMRSVIARRLTESKQNIPHFYLAADVDAGKLMKLRKELNEQVLPHIEGGGKVSVNDMVVKAVALALKQHPDVNAAWGDDAITQFGNVDVSVAVAIDDGLITPIVFNADRKSLYEISSDIKTLVKKAKGGQLRSEEFQGGGFAVSNLGMYGVDSFQAIVNPPQAAILAVGGIIKKPIVINDEVCIGNIMNLTLSCDHRIIDGAVAAQFMQTLRNHIEQPLLLFR